MASPRNGVSNETSVNGGSAKDNEIDREKVCPLLLRVFCANSRHNNLSDYNRGKCIYFTWLFLSLELKWLPIFTSKIWNLTTYVYLQWLFLNLTSKITSKKLKFDQVCMYLWNEIDFKMQFPSLCLTFFSTI